MGSASCKQVVFKTPRRLLRPLHASLFTLMVKSIATMVAKAYKSARDLPVSFKDLPVAVSLVVYTVSKYSTEASSPRLPFSHLGFAILALGIVRASTLARKEIASQLRHPSQPPDPSSYLKQSWKPRRTMFGAEGIPFFLSSADRGEKTFQPRRCSKFLNKIERISLFSASDQGFPPGA